MGQARELPNSVFFASILQRVQRGLQNTLFQNLLVLGVPLGLHFEALASLFDPLFFDPILDHFFGQGSAAGAGPRYLKNLKILYDVPHALLPAQRGAANIESCACRQPSGTLGPRPGPWGQGPGPGPGTGPCGIFAQCPPAAS